MDAYEKQIRSAMQALFLPEYMQDGVVNYLIHGYKPGGFLTALFANDLMGALGRADENNRRCIFEWGQFIHMDMPSPSHGSYEIVDAWCKSVRENKAGQEVPEISEA